MIFQNIFNLNRRHRNRMVHKNREQWILMRNIYRKDWLNSTLRNRKIDLDSHDVDMFIKYEDLIDKTIWFEELSNAKQIKRYKELEKHEDFRWWS